VAAWITCWPAGVVPNALLLKGEHLLPQIFTKSEAQAYAKRQQQRFDLCQFFDYTRKVTCAFNSSGTAEIQISNAADFECFGYNIEFTAGTSGAIDVLSVKMRQARGNRQWSNDFVPVASIATPGVRNVTTPVPRFGYRYFPGFLPAKDVLSIDWQNSDTALAVEMEITMCGLLIFR
jgi:hypothetical protein